MKKIKKNDTTFFLVPLQKIGKKWSFEEIGRDDTRSMRRAMLNAFYNNFLHNPEVLEHLHYKMAVIDPEFYSRLAIFFITHSLKLQDFIENNFLASLFVNKPKVYLHRKIFLSYLLTSESPELRKAGAELIAISYPSEISKAMDLCRQVSGKLPRTAKTAIRNYLRNLERDHLRFDKQLLDSKKHLKHLYASLRIKPSPRAQKILFENDPPRDSLAYGLKQLRTEYDGEALMAIVEKYKIPYLIAIQTIRYFSLDLAIRFVEKMTYHEILDTYHIFQKKGVLRNEELQTVIAAKAERSCEEKIHHFLPQERQLCNPQFEPGLLDETAKRLREQMVTIRKPTAVFADISGSMAFYGNITKSLTYLLYRIGETEHFFLYLYSDSAFKVENEEALQNASFRGKGSSSPGCALRRLMEDHISVEQIILITDGNENALPLFAESYAEYTRKMHTRPYIILIKLGNFIPRLERSAAKSGLHCLVTEFTGYETTIQSLFPILSGPPFNQTADSILESEFPITQQAFDCG